jgi:hypothetical protein
MTDNVITSENVAPKKTTKVKSKQIDPVVVPSGEKIIVYFESGYSYSLSNSFTFTKDNRMLELPAEDAKKLLALDNFRLPNDEEKKLYYNGVEV